MAFIDFKGLFTNKEKKEEVVATFNIQISDILKALNDSDGSKWAIESLRDRIRSEIVSRLFESVSQDYIKMVSEELLTREVVKSQIENLMVSSLQEWITYRKRGY